VLWPYRRSAIKNQQRFTWGGVYPRGWPEGPARLHTECLLRAESPAAEVTVRFLHVIDRAAVDADGMPVDELVVDGERHLSWEEAVEREVTFGLSGGGPIEIRPGSEREEVAGDAGSGGALVRGWGPLRGTVSTSAKRLDTELHRIRVEVANDVEWDGGGRARTLKGTLCSTHVVLHSPSGRFLSLTDPPPDAAEHARECDNDGLWPVLVGEHGDSSTVLASPIILEDYPRVAPESPGDLFDGSEIDQLLTLNILALTDDEKDEMRATDPRAREILDRTEDLDGDELMRLHGALRDMRQVER
jgi:hypothetical protein